MVYNMYNEESISNEKPKYKITQENINEILLDLLVDKSLQDLNNNINDFDNFNNLIISKIYNPNIYLNIHSLYTYIDNNSINKNNIINKLESLYLYYNNINKYSDNDEYINNLNELIIYIYYIIYFNIYDNDFIDNFYDDFINYIDYILKNININNIFNDYINKIIINKLNDIIIIIKNEIYFNDQSKININNIFYIKSKLINIHLKNYECLTIDNNVYFRTYSNTYDNNIININPYQSLMINKNLGQSIINLFDEEATFYLIHPYEKLIIRNIFNKKINIISNNDIRHFIDYCYSKYLICDINTIYVSYNITSNTIKTDLAKYILGLNNILKLNIDKTYIILVASILNCEIEVYEILMFLELLDYSIKNIKNDNISWNSFRKIYKCNSDIIFLYNIIKNIKKNFKDLLIFNIF